MDCSSDSLFIGESDLPGAWRLPKSEIQAELDRQVQNMRLEKQNREKALLAKYDRNHNGTFDPEEIESAIADPDFLAFELETIDVNGNGQLDPKELRYFDANKNGILEPQEEAGIHVMQQLLAAKLLKEFDQNEDGRLDQREFMALYGNNPNSAVAFNVFKSFNGASEVDLLAQSLESTLEGRLRNNPVMRRPGLASGIYGAAQPELKSLKDKVESYWAREQAGM
jgi:Ca2+-binding EF-hand superfamily protein